MDSRFLPLSLLWVVLLSCQDGKASTADRDAQIAALVLTRPAAATTTATTINCSVANPRFSTLADAGFQTSCGRSGCHDGGNRYNSTNYDSVKGWVTPGVPTQSTLYNAQNNGSMKIYTTPALSQAIYCWVQGGANP